MLILAGANDKFSLITSGAADVDVTAHFMDASNADPPVVKGSTASAQLTTITTATTTDILAVPGASVIRSVSALTIRNTHATVATDVTLQLNRSAVLYEIFKTNLLPGDVLTYEDGLGWYKTAALNPDSQYIRKGSDTTNATTSFADAGGLGFAVVANGVYELEWDLLWTSNTVTVGIGFGVNGPASPTSIQGTIMIIGGSAVTVLGDVAARGFVAYDDGPISTTAVSTSVTYGARISALLQNGSTAGTVTPRHKSETATITTVKAGSFGTCRRLA